MIATNGHDGFLKNGKGKIRQGKFMGWRTMRREMIDGWAADSCLSLFTLPCLLTSLSPIQLVACSGYFARNLFHELVLQEAFALGLRAAAFCSVLVFSSFRVLLVAFAIEVCV